MMMNITQNCNHGCYFIFSITDTNSSLPYQCLSNSLDKNGLGQQQLFTWEPVTVRNPQSNRKRIQFNASITETIYRVSWYFERGSTQDYLTEIAGPQRELANFKSGFGEILEMTTAYYYRYCKYECGQLVAFQDNVVSKNGRKIPLQENGLPHNCPNSYFNKRRQELHNSDNESVKEFDKMGQSTLIDFQVRYPDPSPDWNPNQRQPPLNPNRNITQEQQLYVDTIGPAVLEILSIVHDIKQFFIQEKERGVY